MLDDPDLSRRSFLQAGGLGLSALAAKAGREGVERPVFSIDTNERFDAESVRSMR